MAWRDVRSPRPIMRLDGLEHRTCPKWHVRSSRTGRNEAKVGARCRSVCDLGTLAHFVATHACLCLTVQAGGGHLATRTPLRPSVSPPSAPEEPPRRGRDLSPDLASAFHLPQKRSSIVRLSASHRPAAAVVASSSDTRQERKSCASQSPEAGLPWYQTMRSLNRQDPSRIETVSRLAPLCAAA